MDLADLGAVDARMLIGRKAISPVELAQDCLARVEKVNGAVNAMVALDADGLMAQARAAEAAVMAGDPLGPLHGLPIAIKDMTDVAGLPTTYGSELFADNVAASDGPLVARLRRAGAGILGKTNVPEWSAGGNSINRVYGVTRNPFDLTRSAAGSSGGSAAALACGMAPLASGSDMGGSLRNPAAFCGVVGFRPSPGMVPSPMRETALLPMGTDGPMARSVADLGLMLGVMAEADGADPFSPVARDTSGFHPLAPVDLSRLRVAVSEDFGFAPVEDQVRQAFRRAVAVLLSHLGPVEERAPDCRDADRIFAVLRSTVFLALHDERQKARPDLVGPNVTANLEEARGYSALDVAQALQAQSAYQRRWWDFFDTADVIVTPAVTIGPRDWTELFPTEIGGRPTESYYHWLAMAYASTLAGCPSITIPCGMDDNAMPFGLQIIGRRQSDAQVLRVAAALEAVIAASPLAPRRPDLAALTKARPEGCSERVRMTMA